MGKSKLGPWSVAAIVVVAMFAFVGGWLLLDKMLEPYFIAEGARAGYQENTRTELMEQPVVFVGAEVCGQCHPEVRLDWLYSAHGSVTCESCHAPGVTHIVDSEEMLVNDSPELCLGCHTSLTARPSEFPQVDDEAHSQGRLCIQCHNPMHPGIFNPAAPRRAHFTYEGLDCLVCHGSDSPKPVPESHVGRTMASCGQCHQGEVAESGDNPEPTVPDGHMQVEPDSCGGCHQEEGEAQ